MKMRVLGLALSVLGVVASQSQASVIVDYQFLSNSLAPTSTDPNVTAGSISAGSGLTIGASPANTLPISTSSTSSALALTNNSYFEFTVTPNAGYQMDLSTMDLTGGKQTGFTASYAIRSSIDAYSTNIGAGVVTANYPTTGQYVSDISPLFAVTVPTIFRVYIWGNNPANNPIFTQVTLNGTVRLATPEPSTIALVGIAGGMGLARLIVRRRRGEVNA